MSLFPAYSAETTEQNSDINLETRTDEPKWLENSSYQNITGYLHTNLQNEVWTDSSDEESNQKLSPKCKNENFSQANIVFDSKNDASSKDIKDLSQKEKGIKLRRNRFKNKFAYTTNVKDLYFEDKGRNKRFFTVETLEHSMRPNYKLTYRSLGFNYRKYLKHDRHKRYYLVNLDISKNITKEDMECNKKNSIDINLKIMNQSQEYNYQEKQKSLAEEFNKKLTKYPKNIEIWLEFIYFQDEIIQLASSSERDHIKKLVNQKKLSIVEKGLVVNPDSIELLKLKLYLMSENLPADQFSNQIENMIQKDSKNIILWQALIITTQISCALCKVSKVLHLYMKCFPILKLLNSKIDPKQYDAQILELLYQCLTFLRHAGLWEQMWEIIKINLCLNLNLKQESLQNISTINEKTLMDLEEIILTSKLPLNQLWLRIETLRENCHWIGIDVKKVNDNLIGDEKRLVTAEETTNFIYPTIARESNFRLIILSIFCLKIPLLPTRHCTIKDFQLDHFWNVDSIEFLLPMIYSTIWIGKLNECFYSKNIVRDLLEGNLTSGPQFLKFHPSQELYLDFVRSIFHTVAEKLPAFQRTSILIWWLKFERMLVFLTKNDPLRGGNQNKKVKSIIKNFLKKPENRNNLHFYREYALIIFELGSFDECVQMLKTIIQSQNALDNEEKVAIFSLYRAIFEILLNSNTCENENIQILQETITILKNYISISFNCDSNLSIEEILYNEILKFLMNPVVDETEDMFLLPNIHCDILLCYTYVLFVRNSEFNFLNDIIDLFDKCIMHCNNVSHLCERLYECKISVLQFYEYKSHKINRISLAETINKALQEYPNNFFFLSINAVIQSELPYWKLNMTKKKLNVWMILASCLAGRARASYLKIIRFEDAYRAMVNKMFNFHTTVLKTHQVQNCPLVWRFYILLLQEHDLCKKNGEEIFYQTIAHCPWARSVYISAAEIAPQILPQIQDLIKEKELRMHVTPEELDILRE